MARQSTAAQPGLVQTGQHSPRGVSRTSPSLQTGFKHETAEQFGGHFGQHSPGGMKATPLSQSGLAQRTNAHSIGSGVACLFSIEGAAVISPRDPMEIRNAT